MKKSFRIVSIILVLFLTLVVLASCKNPVDPPDKPNEPSTEVIDFAKNLKLDMASSSLKQVVTVKSFVDGDTTHFNVPTSICKNGVLKARYLAINTPESTGQIEPWGKKASNFTKERLSSAVSILIESDDEKWNLDSTGGRYLVWVWYKPSQDSDYINLNLEILQNGLAVASNSGSNRYGKTCLDAIAQSKRLKLYCYSNQKDPDYPDGDAIVLTLKELRINIKEYEGKKVSFEGVVTKDVNKSIYLQNFDEETGLYFGMTVYYGYSLSSEGLEIIHVGNFIRIVGTVQYYETGGTYQVAGIQYRGIKPNDPDNIQLISSDSEIVYTKKEASDLVKGQFEVELDDKTVTYPYGELVMNTCVELENLKVVSVYTTDDESSSSYGAMSITCEAGGVKIVIRTLAWKDASQSDYENKVIDVKGLVDYFNGSYQVKVISQKDITVH